MSRWPVLWLVAIACLSLSCSPHPDDITLQGSGATFPAPLYQRWFLEYYQLSDRHVRIDYQAIGSGAGTRQFAEGLTEFGASDAPTDDDVKRIRREAPGNPDVLTIPLTAGSVALAYNIPGYPADKELRLSREVLVKILYGEVTEWNDPAITTLNPGVSIPEQRITWVRRSEGSGTTYAFTNHVGAVSKRWKDEKRVGKSITWPVGIGGKGNDGVTALIQQTPGAIGYIEYGYAKLSGLPMAAYENKAGKFVKPGAASGAAALAGAKLPGHMRLFIPDPPRADAYPIVTMTWVLVRQEYDDEKVARTLKATFKWCLTEGQAISDQLGYVPLPESVVRKALAAVDSIKP
jgi:phosphate transport system substrate-binding protein